MSQVPMQLSYTLVNLKFPAAPLWGARSAASCKRQNNSRRQRSLTNSVKGVLAEPLGRSTAADLSQRDKGDESFQPDRLGEVLQRPSIPASGFEPKAKRKVAMHVGYVGTAFRGNISHPGYDCTAVLSWRSASSSSNATLVTSKSFLFGAASLGACFLELSSWPQLVEVPPHVACSLPCNRGAVFVDGDGLP